MSRFSAAPCSHISIDLIKSQGCDLFPFKPIQIYAESVFTIGADSDHLTAANGYFLRLRRRIDPTRTPVAVPIRVRVFSTGVFLETLPVASRFRM